MSDINELQDEELEALNSIYEGDVNFKQISKNTFQYKYGEDDDIKSFLLELVWGDNYPNELPTINLDTFYNRNLLPSIKLKIKTIVSEEGDQWLGCGMTYTLFECLKERVNEILEEQAAAAAAVQAPTVDLSSVVKTLEIGEGVGDKDKGPKKEQLTKAQKRRQWERTDHKGDRVRGWNWVDLVKHLSQTGGKDQDAQVLSST